MMNLFKIHIYSMRCDRSWFLDKFQLFKTKNSLVFHNLIKSLKIPIAVKVILEISVTNCGESFLNI
ncbi:hypothetical protein H6F47_10765 [Sphaerospermopsis sp. FACHB-1094]|uniref:hypothetical protein n=1 Tax=Sphaerospermopsis sp. FACHB-1094 TaxID=2692861 RepID=UPI0016879DFF|nr:hypothetical protein [Sphaerospermopsis sp. FACHB-1094]MBD2132900.1 hypothetical protein [Sphaerospermopsis sp. FACHB-1094]